ncbi:hypothetical protein AgCh_018825 [Apium graveolens]
MTPKAENLYLAEDVKVLSKIEVTTKKLLYIKTDLPGDIVVNWRLLLAGEFSKMMDEYKLDFERLIIDHWNEPLRRANVGKTVPKAKRACNSPYANVKRSGFLNCLEVGVVMDMINSWENGRRVTLLGDAAAYPMQPNLGQGGCMAIEDSYQLILELKKVDMRNSDEESQLKQISESLNRYQSKRMFRVKTVHKVSRLASETLYTYKLSLDFGLSKLSNIFGVQITNYAIDITPRLAALSSQPLRLTSHVVYEQDVDWTPYKSLHKDPARYKEQQLVATYVGAIICNNYVVYHKPHLAAEQFPVLEDFDLQNLCWQAKGIELKQNKGDSEHLLTDYKDHIKEWNERLLLKDHLQKNHSSPSTVHMQRNHPSPHPQPYSQSNSQVNTYPHPNA